MAPTCPFCSETLPDGAPTKCPSCGEPLAARRAPPRGWGSDDQPLSVLIIAGLQVSLSLLGLCGLLLSALFMMFMGNMLGAQAGPAAAAMWGPPGSWYRTYMILAQCLQGGAYVAAVVGGAGLFLMREWGRTLTLGVSTFAILFTLVNAVVTTPVAMANAGGVGPAQSIAAGSIVCGVVFVLVLPAVTLVLLTRGNVVRAFDRWEQARAAGLKRP